MSRHFNLLLSILAFIVVFVSPAHAQIYTVTDLGALQTPGSSEGEAVNDQGLVTGEASVGAGNISLDQDNNVFLWSPYTNKMVGFGALGGQYAAGYGINSGGSFVGSYFDANDNEHAFLCTPPNSSITSLESLAQGTQYPGETSFDPNFPSDSESNASAINANGLIVGASDTLNVSYYGQTPIVSNGPSRACFWMPGSSLPIDLDSPYTNPIEGDEGESTADGVNNNGIAAGFTDIINSNGGYACVWNVYSQSGPIVIDNSALSYAFTINDSDQVAGEYTSTDYSNGTFSFALHACMWQPDSKTGTWQRTDLDPTGQFGTYSEATSINNSGQIVGWGNKPFIWSPTTKKAVDLNSLINPNSGWKLYEANSISNTGYITGVGVYNGETHAFLLKPVLWGARVLLKRTNPTQTINDHLVSFENGQVTLLSGLSFNTTGQITADENAKIPADNIISIQVLSDHPDTQNPADIPGEAGFNKYFITPGVGKGTPTAKYSAKNVIELGQLVGDSIPSLNIGFSNGNWNTIFYQYPGHYSRYPKPFSKDDGYSFYAIPRVPGATNYQNIYNYLTDAASSLSLSALGIQKNRAMPRQVLYGIAWQESPDPYDPNPIAKGKGWNQFGYITYYEDEKAVYDYDSKYGSTNYTMVTVDGGVGIMQITGGIAFDLAAKAHMPDGLDALSGQLTVLYGISGDPAYNIQAGAYTLDGKWATAPSLFRDDAASEFLDHWYYAVGSYNGSKQTYVESVWNWIRTAPYQSVLPGIDDPGLNPVPLPTATSNAAFGDFDLDGQVDIRVSDFQRETSSNGQTPISVQLTPLHPGFVVAQVMASVQLKGTTANRTTPISLENNGSGLWTGNVPASLQTNLSSYFYLDITANGLTKRAVIKN